MLRSLLKGAHHEAATPRPSPCYVVHSNCLHWSAKPCCGASPPRRESHAQSFLRLAGVVEQALRQRASLADSSLAVAELAAQTATNVRRARGGLLGVRLAGIAVGAGRALREYVRNNASSLDGDIGTRPSRPVS